MPLGWGRLVVSLAATIYLGVLPGRVLEYAFESARALRVKHFMTGKLLEKGS